MDAKADEQENWNDHEKRLSVSRIMTIRKLFSRRLPEDQDVPEDVGYELMK